MYFTEEIEMIVLLLKKQVHTYSNTSTYILETPLEYDVSDALPSTKHSLVNMDKYTITEEIASSNLDAYLEKIVNIINQVTRGYFNKKWFDYIVSFVYRIGTQHYGKSLMHLMVDCDAIFIYNNK